jgi:hypothetical protein
VSLPRTLNLLMKVFQDRVLFFLDSIRMTTAEKGTGKRLTILTIECCKIPFLILNWVVRTLNADWLKAMVYQIVYHGNNKIIFYLTLVTSL